MLRPILACAVVFLAICVALVGYNVLILGTGLVGGVSLLGRYWRDFSSEPGTTRAFQWMAIIAVGLMLGLRAGSWREPGNH